MSALKIADVVTLDCILSRDPLAFGLTARRVRGADAVVLLVIYSQFMPAGALKHAPSKGFDIRELVGARIDKRRARGVEQALAREALEVQFVADFTARVQQTDDVIAIEESFTLIDGRTYALGVTIDEAGAALRRLGTI